MIHEQLIFAATHELYGGHESNQRTMNRWGKFVFGSLSLKSIGHNVHADEREVLGMTSQSSNSAHSCTNPVRTFPTDLGVFQEQEIHLDRVKRLL